METLPSYVKILRENYTDGVDWNVRQSAMDNGLRKQRPGRSKVLRVRSAKLFVNGKDNKRSFENWLDNLGGGTEFFNYNDPINGLCKCRFVNTSWEFELTGLDAWVADCEMESVGL